MHCPNCNHDELIALITLEVPVPLAKKGGGIKTAGVPMTHQILKDQWGLDAKGDKKKIRGPIVCPMCDTELVYVSGSNTPLQPAEDHEAGGGEDDED